MVRIGPLSDEQRQALERVRRRAVGRVSQRAHMVLLSARGYTVPQIAEIFEVGEDVVRTWLHRYERHGPARPGRPSPAGQAAAGPPGPADRGRPGEQPAVQQRAGPDLLDGRAAGGLPGGALPPGPVARERPPVPHQAGWRWARPRLAPATHAPRGQRKDDPAAPLKLALIAQALASAATVLYLDECDLHLLPVDPGLLDEGPAGARAHARARTPSGPSSAPWTPAPAAPPSGPAAQAGRALRRLPGPSGGGLPDRRGHPGAGQRDHPRRQAGARLAGPPEHARFQVLWLPKYSAHEHNPIERVWGLLKDAVAANRLHGSIDLLVAGGRPLLRHGHLQRPSSARRHARPRLRRPRTGRLKPCHTSAHVLRALSIW